MAARHKRTTAAPSVASPGDDLDAPEQTTISESCVEFVGSAEALVDAWLILPSWVPSLPRRVLYGRDAHVAGRVWWGLGEDDTEANWERRPARVGSWRIERVKGDRFRLTVRARYCLDFLGGPADPDAGRNAVAWHRRMVRARLDADFQRFLAAVLQTPEAATRQGTRSANR